MNSEIGIIILNYFSAIDTIRLYKALKHYNSVNFSLLVIDNSCDLHEEKLLKEGADEHNIIINSENTGYGTGNNIGIKKMLKNESIEFVVIANPDVDFAPSILEELKHQFQKSENIAAIGPRICFRDQPEKIYSDGGVITKYNGVLYPKHQNSQKTINSADLVYLDEPDYIHGAFIMLSRRAIMDVGFIPEHYFLYFEETDWCLSAKKKGWKMNIDTSTIVYQKPTNRQKVYHYYMARNHIFFNRKFNKGFNSVGLALHLLRKVLSNLKHFNLKIANAILLGLFDGFFQRVNCKKQSST